MRETKYRAWDVYQKKMYQWSEIGTLNEDGHLSLWNLLNDLIAHIYPLEFTGLKDKNGVEIYEGDHLTSDNYPFTNKGLKNYVGIVEFDNGCFYLEMKVISDRVRGAAVGGMLEEYYETCEVIGNIYENP